MAFRKQALLRIGGFDPTHRTAGDDVDVCWKLLARHETIAFSPAGFVWHHRRATVKTYFKQQLGYGYAEAHLRHRYPGHYNLFGYAVWRGGVYDGIRSALNGLELPGLFRSRIYQGRFCSAQFQSVYPAINSQWFHLMTTMEWILITLGMACASPLAAGESKFRAALFFGLSALCASGTLCAAWIAGNHAAKMEKWRGLQRWAGTLLVGCLHIAQPPVRAPASSRRCLTLPAQRTTYRPSA